MTSSSPPDQALLRAHLERQAQALGPIAERLHDAVAHPPISPYDWHGPASRSYAARESQLRDRLRAAEEAVSAALHSTRMALGRIDG